MKTIKRILIDQVGQIYASDGEIESFTINGEMAPIIWFRQNNKEWSGKYVIEIEYEVI